MLIVVELTDRATRFGFRYRETLLAAQGRAIEVMTVAQSDTADLVTDLVSIVSSIAARLYGQGRAKRRAAVVQALLEHDDGEHGSEQTSPGHSGAVTEPVQRPKT